MIRPGITAFTAALLGATLLPIAACAQQGPQPNAGMSFFITSASPGKTSLHATTAQTRRTQSRKVPTKPQSKPAGSHASTT